MKVLDVIHVVDGVEAAEKDLDSFYQRIEKVQGSIRDFRSLDDELKGD